MHRERWLSSSQVSSWFGAGYVDLPSRQIVGKLLVRDANYEGAVHWLGTNFGTQGFTNPYGSKVSLTLSSNYGGSTSPAYAVDRSNSTTAHTNNVANSWVKIDISADNPNRRIVLSEVSIKQRSDFSGHFFQQFYIDASTDDIGWTRVATVTSGVNVGLGLWTNTAILSGASWRYVRLTMTGLNSNNDSYLTLGEIELFGTVF